MQETRLGAAATLRLAAANQRHDGADRVGPEDGLNHELSDVFYNG